MPGILKSNISTYEFSLEQIKLLIAADLKCDVKDLDVQFVSQDVSGPMERSPRYEMKSVRVSQKHK